MGTARRRFRLAAYNAPVRHAALDSLTPAAVVHELFEELGGYAYDRDPGRPGWYSTVPNRDWADPSQSVTPRLRTEAVAIDVKRKGRAS